VKYDNLLEQHLITRKKYYEYFNRVDEKQLKKLESNFFQSIEHLRRFESSLEPWQREALEKRKTERYRNDLTYSQNRGLDPNDFKPEVISEDQIEDPHFKDSQKEAFEMYKDDFEESEGTIEDYLKIKGL
jgi:tRNA splicing endonuclease